jgi:hypothetical protein
MYHQDNGEKNDQVDENDDPAPAWELNLWRSALRSSPVEHTGDVGQHDGRFQCHASHKIKKGRQGDNQGFVGESKG